MRPIFAILTIATALAFAGSATAQSDSHIAIPEWGGTRSAADVARQLSTRLRPRPATMLEPELAKKLQDMLQNNPDPEKWKSLLKNDPDLERVVRGNINNPAFREQIQNLLKDRTEIRGPVPRETVDEKLRSLRQAVDKPADAGPGVPHPDIRPSDMTTDSAAPQTPLKPLDGSSPKGATPAARQPPKVAPPRVNDKLSRDFAKSMERWFPKSMSDSPAMKKLAADLGKKDWGKIADSTFGKTGKGSNVNWNKVGNRLQGTGRFMERNLPRVSGRRLPDLPTVNTPTLPRGPTLPSMGAPSAGGAAEAGGTVTLLMALAALLVGGYLLWRLILRPMQQAKGTTVETEIGPWPVDPTRIRTREELVKAFDYLTLWSCGKPSRMWHHREVANRLGADDTQRRQTAASLAETYAHARYAPPAEPLDEPTALRARHDLSALAGGAVS